MLSVEKLSDTAQLFLCVSDSDPLLKLPVVILLDLAAVPHTAVDDDMYRGFHIPKGIDNNPLSQPSVY